MISVNRGSVPAPPGLLGEGSSEAYAAARQHFEADTSDLRQKLFTFQPLYGSDAVRSALSRLFSDKCAFCESPLGKSAESGVVHHFRPKQEAVDEDGTVSRPHYWWLAFRWENLYLACNACVTAAGAQFPVEGARAPIGAKGEALDDERPMLLDPCHDDSELDLEFGYDGSVTGRSRRGEVTVTIFALNRSPLVEARQQAIAVARAAPSEYLQDLTRPYAGALRGVFRSSEVSALVPRVSLLGSFSGAVREALTRVNAGLHRLTDSPPPVGPVVVERLELRNFRSIEHLEFDLASSEDEAPWTMLLGENGHGKTSVLQALGLVLMGQDARDRLGLDLNGLIRYGAKEAEIVAYLRGALEPRRIHVALDGGRFEVDGDDYPLAVAAYGAARIPSTRRRLPGGRTTGRPRVENLFDPATPLVAADRWLTSRAVSEPSFDFCARAIRRLLLESETTVVERKDRRVVLSTSDGPKDLGQLSDGYRSMIALAADIMSFFTTRYGSMDAAEGVVLVDEIGAHLHPRWQMRVVEAFREAFPRLQFVVTTHDPLCLRGLTGARDVVVLRRTDDGQVYSLPRDEIPSVRGLRVDELLTSEVFGLSSTMDPDLERAFDRYYTLLAEPDPGPEVLPEIEDLKKKLDAHHQLGITRRERLVFGIADEHFAAEHNVPGATERAELLAQTKERLRSVWKREDRR
jgi:uncharacterized protein (TIGR02646 family)